MHRLLMQGEGLLGRGVADDTLPSNGLRKIYQADLSSLECSIRTTECFFARTEETCNFVVFVAYCKLVGYLSLSLGENLVVLSCFF